MNMKEPVAVFYADLNLAVDEWQSAASWDEIIGGLREHVVSGAPVVVTDTDDAFLATVTELTSSGPHLAIHWDRAVPVPPAASRAATLT